MGWWVVLAHPGGTERDAVEMNRAWRAVRLMVLTRFGGTDWHIGKVNQVWGVMRLLFLGKIEPGSDQSTWSSVLSLEVSKKALLSRPGGEAGLVAS